MSKQWWKCAGIRAIKTIAQTCVAMIPVAVTVSDVDWINVVSTSVVAGLLSLLTSITGLPEIEESEE